MHFVAIFVWELIPKRHLFSISTDTPFFSRIGISSWIKLLIAFERSREINKVMHIFTVMVKGSNPELADLALGPQKETKKKEEFYEGLWWIRIFTNMHPFHTFFSLMYVIFCDNFRERRFQPKLCDKKNIYIIHSPSM